jgi:hypothetical protein
MYNLYSILKTTEHDVLVIRRLHPVYLAIRAWVRTPSPAPLFNILRRFNQMPRRLTGRPTRSVDVSCLHYTTVDL